MAICRAISNSCKRDGTCATKAAGVASVTLDVTAIPVAHPIFLAASISVSRGCESGPTPMAPLNVLTPVEYDVAPAALSVMGELAERVSMSPMILNCWTARFSEANRAAVQ